MKIPTKADRIMDQGEQNSTVVLEAKLKELEIIFKGWLAKQLLLVEATIVTTISATQGAAIELPLILKKSNKYPKVFQILEESFLKAFKIGNKILYLD
ncbi:mitochondrial import inner membrane translocase subunit TIM22-like [Olea europaea subsp. europaea]|uniref:Mitochondrial import inner membrane translocase subunit TIM22-like n=1 Tax=Olea europaea subsp. europaea TaxID=158383 RepID=A0A8S0TV83_OLEEU|nr:mitochondrial import inner membrane translocase subunit TIM22-like [Olea europaea subsp. europaea]